MDIKIIKSVFKNLQGYENNMLSLDFLASKRVYEFEYDENVVTKLINNIYKLNSISLAGINASGKTTTLNIISDNLKIFIQNQSLNYQMIFSNYFNEKLEIENYFYHDGFVYKLISFIQKDDRNQLLIFDEEFLYEKKINSNIAKKDFLLFDGIKPKIVRSTLENNFLKPEDSVFSSILNTMDTSRKKIIKDMGHQTNFNYLSIYSEQMPISFVNYLDSSIEEFCILNQEMGVDKVPKFKIKFKGHDKEIISDFIELEKYLSSGTIKGINILMNMMLVLNSGGYLLIDEIENHLNKTIVINIIDMFTSLLNKNGATLIFTTHYSEILDSIDRSDSIYVLNKSENISLNKFSTLAYGKDRSDKKKSDLLLNGGEFKTAPSYSGYRQLIKDMKRFIEEAD
ncbi:ATP-binding protein [Listeria booriae]|uniref:AAA family ATPase n=1 Tax=Listeria booriae TaxID=1552123 RepID=UPI001629B303|nr:AAA family ATPase [Listeria booriae]MBC1503988.1 ATP-binding protein [Listeria booriae]MBC1523068.1 ATP-binding protein [Listeria booriae]MBC1528977.1 ATP-binding protein [Listeria booriae]MBC6134695.1 ATP-binding protein [Listeria booriae]